jgi:aspartyl protease family protein
MVRVVRRFLLLLLLAIAPAPFAQGADGAARAPVSGLRVARAHDGLFYVTARVNGRPVRFLVDTGANYVTLTGADARRIGLDRGAYRYGGQIATAAGARTAAWARLNQVEVAGRQVQDLQVTIIDQGLPVSLMGQNLLSRLNQVRIEGDHLSLG